MCNCALCHLPNVDGQIDPYLGVVHVEFHCMLCGQAILFMLVCDQCPRG